MGRLSGLQRSLPEPPPALSRWRARTYAGNSQLPDDTVDRIGWGALSLAGDRSAKGTLASDTLSRRAALGLSRQRAQSAFTPAEVFSQR
jgi:hypothetical protein